MIISLIVAVAKNNVIGKDNDLIWRLPNDMKFFKEKTLNHHIITGRKNYISIPKKFRPLSDRVNIVLTKQKGFTEEGCVIANSLEDAIAHAKAADETELFIIGGGQIYKESLEKELIDRMYITHVDETFVGDTFFPKIDTIKWKEKSKIENLADAKHAYNYTFTIYDKIK